MAWRLPVGVICGTALAAKLAESKVGRPRRSRRHSDTAQLRVVTQPLCKADFATLACLFENRS